MPPNRGHFLFVSCCRNLVDSAGILEMRNRFARKGKEMVKHLTYPAKEDRISWSDVWNWCADLEATWHCYAEFKLWRVRKEGFYGVWDVQLTVRWLGVGGVVSRTEALAQTFPNNTTKSLPALQLRMLVEMDRKLDELAREKKEGAHEQGRFA